MPDTNMSGATSSASIQSKEIDNKKVAKTARRVCKKAREKERRVESVTYGDVRFTPWYPSWYPKELSPGTVIIKELYVCPKCFAYSAGVDDGEVRAWLRHWRTCSRTVAPGEKVYVHGSWAKGQKSISATRSQSTARNSARGTWSIWEVDGARETLFCQNLSLFAKLFLDNKSVFFDVSGFNYFLLVHTPPTNQLSDTESVPQIIGFFSKEKLSWDNNNLACILVFPPWQSKGFGSLLIGVSYAIARREGIMGGPERPISELGMKSYRSYWGKEISRFLLHWDGDFESRINIKTISEKTWITPDDCLATLKEMNAVELSESSQKVPERQEQQEMQDKWAKRDDEQDTLNPNYFVRLDKERVRNWMKLLGIRPERSICEEGFRPGYALKASRQNKARISGSQD